jgi:hypothetical protein
MIFTVNSDYKILDYYTSDGGDLDILAYYFVSTSKYPVKSGSKKLHASSGLK